jgi:hypothetical protein
MATAAPGRLEDIADNVWVKIVARASMPIAAFLASYVSVTMHSASSTLDTLRETTIRLEDKVASVSDQVGADHIVISNLSTRLRDNEEETRRQAAALKRVEDNQNEILRLLLSSPEFRNAPIPR